MADKVLSLAAAAARVDDGATLSIGGFTSQRHPTALLRELVRRRVRDLVVYCHSAGSELDLLIGAGSVRRVEGAYLADGVFAATAPNWRRWVEGGRLEWEDYSNAAMAARFQAGASGLPFLPVRSMLGSDLLTESALDPARQAADPRAASRKAATITCPFSGETLVAVPAVRTELCLLHVQRASPGGLVQIDGQEFLDLQQALAAEQVLVTCERLVEDAELRRQPERNRLPPFAVHGVVEVPFGAHPHSVHGCYDYDPEHLAEYTAAAAGDAEFAGYLDRYVFGVADHAGYLEAVGGAARLEALRARDGLGYNPELPRARRREAGPR